MVRKYVLVVEDECKIAELLREYLVRAGFVVTTVERGDLAIAEIRKNAPALVLLDIMLPGMDGMEVCREIRKFSNIPIIMITARIDEIDRVLGLELGADDYVCKPFSPREVVARVKTVLRRSQPQPAEPQLRVGPITMDCATRQVSVSGKRVNLTPNEFALLRALMARPNRVFTRGELLNLVQGYNFDGYERTIDSHIKNLRKKMSEKLPQQEVIRTVYGVGYKLSVSAADSGDDFP
ncbi:MAG: response regulator [Thermodesulfobacteriota bacterium]